MSDLTKETILLPEVIVYGKRSDWFTRNIVNPVKRFILLEKETNPIFGRRRVRNMQKVLKKNPHAMDNWKVAENVGEFVNIASAGILNRLSPSQNVGLVIDAFQGDNIMNSWFGNSGIVSDNFMREHPYLSLGINGTFDFGVGTATNAVLNSPNAFTLLKHPTYVRYTRRNGVKGMEDLAGNSPNNVGIHANRAGSGQEITSGQNVVEFYAPRASGETFDPGGAHNLRSMITERTFLANPNPVLNHYGMPQSFYFDSPNNSFLRGLLGESEGNVLTWIRNGSEGRMGFTLKEPRTLNPLEDVYTRFSPLQKADLRSLYERYPEPLLTEGYSNETIPIRSELHQLARLIFKDAGYDVLKYQNTNPYEGYGTSYIIMSPDKIVIPQASRFNMPWLSTPDSNNGISGNLTD